MDSYGQYNDLFKKGVPVGSRRFRLLFLTKTLITIASYGFPKRPKLPKPPKPPKSAKSPKLPKNATKPPVA